ncbi:TIGR01621 family pseudouridine synthase [Thalassotalea piscium]|uniref:tRNA pseudouridine32 synthase/23S rRNA pseudouridine746 synthase n=1 Tax=Thalassotalea piscium TaxID=1230533 RepID=A0A7X0NDV4_9GAMM|nr:TIGR01621 family pseudouridine synthase [Thalassotalea piscium]MBB6541568.1 tRNA pseudouridine32 synthase/23S rRNA pseudouridine746 synthase [Thalassotalea piscium]
MSVNNSSITIEVINNNTDFVVIDKPEGVNFHDETDLGQGLFNQVKQQLNLEVLYPVHRLDKMTSGLIIFAKTLACAQWFQQQFEQHTIEKYYLALSDQKPVKKQGLIKGDMVKSRRGMWKLTRSQNNPAITQFFSYTLASKTRLFILKPHTGKTHQIRVALNSIGAPIIGDSYYHSNERSDRGYLHAYAIRFSYCGQRYHFMSSPQSGELFTQQALVQLLMDMGKPWALNWPKIRTRP